MATSSRPSSGSRRSSSRRRPAAGRRWRSGPSAPGGASAGRRRRGRSPASAGPAGVAAAPMTYAGQPIRAFAVSEVASSICASKPIPAITAKCWSSTDARRRAGAGHPRSRPRCRRPGRWRAEVGGEQVAGAGRQHGHRRLGADQRAERGHHGAVAAAGEDDLGAGLDGRAGRPEPGSSGVARTTAGRPAGAVRAACTVSRRRSRSSTFAGLTTTADRARGRRDGAVACRSARFAVARLLTWRSSVLSGGVGTRAVRGSACRTSDADQGGPAGADQPAAAVSRRRGSGRRRRAAWRSAGGTKFGPPGVRTSACDAAQPRPGTAASSAVTTAASRHCGLSRSSRSATSDSSTSPTHSNGLCASMPSSSR